ncbi:hypothetical protein HYW42_05650 [Candidatus Daviesbacteria bacterium]|nr:hypothetical protein [Candidatus Daviesbacteria bacterium]
MTGFKLPRDKKENIRLFRIYEIFSDLKKLRSLMTENKGNQKVLEFLYEFREMPIAQLEAEGVDRMTSEALFIFDGVLTPEFIESFRQTESRPFWG